MLINVVVATQELDIVAFVVGYTVLFETGIERH